MENKYLKVIEALGEVIIKKDLDIELLKYENQKLQETINDIENFANNCEMVNK